MDLSRLPIFELLERKVGLSVSEIILESTRVELRGHLHRTVPIARFAYGPKPVLGVFWPYL